MNSRVFHLRVIAATLLATVTLQISSFAQNRGNQPPPILSPEVAPDRHITFRIQAPKAESVKLNAGDIPTAGQAPVFTKGTNGVWETTLGPVNPGTYRYTFNVDGLAVIDPRNASSSESMSSLSSMVNVPGSDFMDTKDVPHGAVASVNYYSKSLGKYRRLHVYTPPGYENGKGKFPIFYLLHGAGDSDDSWTSVGRAGFIMDNLIAAKKAKPMVIVMPAGHIRGAANPAPGAPRPAVDDYTRDFVGDIMPTVEKSYRVYTDRSHRAIAGLSMGGSQTLNIAIPHLDQFAYVGVYSSGLFGQFPMNRGGTNAPAAPTGPTWEQQNLATLDNAALKKGLKLFWFGTGKDDFLLETTRKTVGLFKQHGFKVDYDETEGAHTWIVWRNYLNDFAPKLFR